MTIGTLSPTEKDLYKIVALVRQLAERNNAGVATADLNDNAVTGTKLADDAVANAKLADMAQATFKMRAAGAGTGDPIDGTVEQAWAALQAGAHFKAGSLSRDMTAASGNVAYTGIGFRPSAIFLLANVNGTVAVSWGFTTGVSNNVSILDNNGTGTYAISTNKSVYLSTSAGNDQQAALASFDGDGFTLSWTKSGAPTGTGTVMFLAMR